MYQDFFKLARKPFQTTPDPSFIYWSSEHSLAFAMMTYGVMNRAPLTVITGEIGSGKTTLLRQLLRESPNDLKIALISNMQAGRGELLHWVFMALDLPFGDEPYVQLFKRFQDYVIRLYAEGRQLAIIIDEAQNLSVEALEELRMFSNINADGDDLLQIILIGQPELRDLLSRPDLKQFKQRIVSDFHLKRLNAEDVETYVNYRLSQADAQWRIFSSDACDLIHEATLGVPRLINILCDLAMAHAYSCDRKTIDAEMLREFLADARKHGIYRQFEPVSDASSAAVAPLRRNPV